MSHNQDKDEDRDEERAVLGAGIVGVRITDLRPLSDEEMAGEGWYPSRVHGRPMALVLENGVVLYAAADPEGNGPGCLFGLDALGEAFRIGGFPDDMSEDERDA